MSGSGSSGRRRWPVAGLVVDALRPGATSTGCVFPLILVLVAIALIVSLFAHAVLPWTIYPAL